MIMRKLLLPLFITLLIIGTPVNAEPVVIVNARSEVDRLSQDEVINIFLGRYRRLPNGDVAIPVDQPDSSALKNQFYRKLVNKNLNEINAYWSRLIFSGKTSPPKQAVNAAEVAALMSGNSGGVSYIERAQVDNRFRIVYEFPK